MIVCMVVLKRQNGLLLRGPGLDFLREPADLQAFGGLSRSRLMQGLHRSLKMLEGKFKVHLSWTSILPPPPLFPRNFPEGF